MLIKGYVEQPFRLDDKIMVDRRTEDGELDLRGSPQPPSTPITLRELYKMYFIETKDRASAGWAELKEWLDARRWSIRPCYWE